MNLLKAAQRHQQRQPTDYTYLSGSHTDTAFSQSIDQLNSHPNAGLMEWDMYVKKDRLGLWSARKKIYFDFYHWTCQVCRQRRATQLHHRTYAHVSRELLHELVPICGRCHAIEHGIWNAMENL